MQSDEKRRIPKGWWFWVAGLAAFLWFVLRTGTQPRRLTYPCQRAAFPLASAWVVAVLTLLGGGALLRRTVRLTGSVFVGLAVLWLLFSVASDPSARTRDATSPPVWEVDNPVSTLFMLDSLPPTAGSLAAGDSTVPDAHLPDPAVDMLLEMMAAGGIPFFRTTEHPEGIVGPDNVVIIKGNYQWSQRNTTSTDRVKGVVWQILNHPEGFTGEIMICDNTQNIGTSIGHEDNNSEDLEQSIVDVVLTFKDKGYPVRRKDWNQFYSVVADEYDQGDYTDGFVYDPATKVTYPKFRSKVLERWVSLARGVWDSTASTYDRDALTIIDFPVLKAHWWAGATVAVKNWVGVMTTAYDVERYGGFGPMHDDYLFGSYALTARILGETWPDLTIVDATWTSPYDQSHHSGHVNTQILVGSLDPVAASWYTAKYILTPIATFPLDTDPDLPGSPYNVNLTSWTAYLQGAGFPVTMDSTEISVYDDSILDLVSVLAGQTALEGEGLGLACAPNPFRPTTTIRFALARPSAVDLTIHDAAGRLVRRLVGGELRGVGRHTVDWDGTDDAGRSVGTGVYFCRVAAEGRQESEKLIRLR
jgi:uncharacterized protein (DUF362 family)